jgi:hypothetical protein
MHIDRLPYLQRELIVLSAVPSARQASDPACLEFAGLFLKCVYHCGFPALRF